ncbi:MAG: hypothetical protein ICV55_16215 [Coleofasciculus sp. C3-bin4]|jgi:hypothetical protein|nr:hypothetical protein [Coleofasciculus sp. C3-bin4]
MDNDQLKQILTERMATGPGQPWFEPVVDPIDQFVPPDFTLSQIFFTQQTAAALVQALDVYANPCCLCTPRLAAEWARRGRRVTLLDIDPKFAEFAEFLPYDLRSPQPINREFDVIIADPPFFIPEPVHQAIDILAGDRRPDLFLVFAVEHEAELLRLFAEYRLQPTDFNLRHSNVLVSHQPLFRLYGSQPNLVCG